MKSNEIRDKFLAFFKERGHAIVPSSSLIPDDPSVLLTTAGMQQFKKYYTGEADAMKDFGSKSTASVQKSFRTSDIDEVGDESHLTFFEMLGNFSFGGYWKEDAIKYAWQFLTGGIEDGCLGISEKRIHVTVHDSIPLGRDDESYNIWKNKIGISEKKIKTGGIDDNFWGPTGSSGPCGPTTEIYVDGVEIWNIVFNEFFSQTSREVAYKKGWKLKDLDIRGIDTGMGFERLAMISRGVKNIFETDIFAPLIKFLPSGISEKTKRVIADHARAITFLISDGVRPSHKEAGYVLHRLMRRLIAQEYLAGELGLDNLFNFVVQGNKNTYPELNSQTTVEEFKKEQERSTKTLKSGLHEEQKFIDKDGKTIFQNKGIEVEALETPEHSGSFTFEAYQSLGIPYEVTIDNLEKNKIYLADPSGTASVFTIKMQEHASSSAVGYIKKFGGHGLILDTGELKAANEEELKKVTRLHTATHLLQKALRNVLGDEVKQAGSDITVERTRFDFTFPRKLTPEEIKKVETEVNEIIKKDLPVSFKEMPIEEAKKTGALYFFREKYPEKVKVYYVGPSIEEAWSKEFCGGPHVTHTGEIGVFKIAKEEAVGAGVRRVRGIVQ